MQQSRALVPSSIFNPASPLSLRAEDAVVDLIHNFFSFVLTALAADTASSTLIVILILFNLFSTEIVPLLSSLVCFKPILVDVHPVEKKSSDRLVYDRETEGWDFGLIQTL